MKIIIHNGVISATATDEYVSNGTEQAVIDAPANFDISRMADYTFAAGVLTLTHSVMSKLDFINRFTEAELASIYSAAKVSIAVEVWLDKFRLAADISVVDPRTVAGVQALEGAGLIAAGRAAVILA